MDKEPAKLPPSLSKKANEGFDEWMDSVSKKIRKPGLPEKGTSDGFDDTLEARLNDMVEENFNNYDHFKKGFLDMDDFGLMLKKNTGKFFSQKEVKDLLLVADKNQDKVIDRKELKSFFHKLITEVSKLKHWWTLIVWSIIRIYILMMSRICNEKTSNLKQIEIVNNKLTYFWQYVITCIINCWKVTQNVGFYYTFALESNHLNGCLLSHLQPWQQILPSIRNYNN